jgi:membrane-bound lytic murein transglycosylase A
MKAATRRAILVIGLTVAACAPARDPAPPPVAAGFAPVEFSDLPGWGSDRTADALAAMRKSCARLLKLPAARSMTDRSVGGKVGDWVSACQSLPPRNAGDLVTRQYFESLFKPYRVLSSGGADGLLTGYFEPVLMGSRAPSEIFHVPLYQRPKDLILVTLGDWRDKFRGERIAGRSVNGRLKPYHSRAEIVAGALVDKAQPLVWVDDPIDAFFLHIQGSGRVSLPDGGTLRVGYDGHNGHVYRAIGRDLLKAGAIEKKDISLQSIRAWLKANPDRMHEMMNRNPSYIFFRAVRGEGPIGAQGVPLTPGRSLAVDPGKLPLGAPVWVTSDYQDETGRPLRRLMIAQDTGGAIRGAVRGDVFWGHGDKARALAGAMKATGRMYLLLPRSLKVAPGG